MGQIQRPGIESEKEFWDQYEAFEWLTQKSIEAILSFSPSMSGDILELCSGSGMFTGHMGESFRSYTCLDLSRRLSTRLKKDMLGIHAVVGNAVVPPFRSDSFDQVLVFAGLHHLPDLDQTIQNAHLLLRPGGHFTCFEPNDRCWYRQPMKLMKKVIGFYSDDEGFLDPYAIQRTILEAGFQNFETRYLTVRYTDEFLSSRLNKLLAQMMYLTGRFSNTPLWQPFFITRARKG